jgi:hypothetical protein
MTDTNESIASTTVPETYTTNETGNYVGEDGFIVPKDFGEFYSRFPTHVAKYVRQRRGIEFHEGTTAHEDLEQAILLHLMAVGEKSKTRAEGFFDRIQTFDPAKKGGASERRFMCYVFGLMHNFFIDTYRKRQRDVMYRAVVWEDGRETILDHLVWNDSAVSKFNTFYGDFFTFVGKHNPEILPFMETLMASPGVFATRSDLLLSRQLFLRSRRRLRVLFNCFNNGEAVPKQRKVYPLRKSKPVQPLDSIVYTGVEV